jgi:hypothetical protein
MCIHLAAGFFSLGLDLSRLTWPTVHGHCTHSTRLVTGAPAKVLIRPSGPGLISSHAHARPHGVWRRHRIFGFGLDPFIHSMARSRCMNVIDSFQNRSFLFFFSGVNTILHP